MNVQLPSAVTQLGTGLTQVEVKNLVVGCVNIVNCETCPSQLLSLCRWRVEWAGT